MNVLTLLLITALLLGPATAPTSFSEVRRESKDTALSNEFEARARLYMQFRDKVAGKAPKPNDAAEMIVADQQRMADKIRVARAGAKQGEIFTPSIAQYFRRQIASSLAGPHGKEIRASLRHAEPVKMELQINESYPESVPFQSTPPTLLLNLPSLPDGLEYRILDRELVLRDRDANIAVDYVPNALPELAK